MELTVGIKGHDEVVVDMTNVASAVGSGALDVFSTPSMIACMERAALSSVMPYMDEGFSTVGIGLDVQHLAATPIGETVRTESELIEIVKQVKKQREEGKYINDKVFKEIVKNTKK